MRKCAILCTFFTVYSAFVYHFFSARLCIAPVSCIRLFLSLTMYLFLSHCHHLQHTSVTESLMRSSKGPLKQEELCENLLAQIRLLLFHLLLTHSELANLLTQCMHLFRSACRLISGVRNSTTRVSTL